MKNMRRKIIYFKESKISYEKLLKSFQGWHAYTKWADSYNLTDKLIKSIINYSQKIS